MGLQVSDVLDTDCADSARLKFDTTAWKDVQRMHARPARKSS